MGHKVSRNETLVVGFLPSIKPFGMGLGEEKERTSWKPPRGLPTQAHAGSLEYMEAMQAFAMSFRCLGSPPSFLGVSPQLPQGPMSLQKRVSQMSTPDPSSAFP